MKHAVHLAIGSDGSLLAAFRTKEEALAHSGCATADVLYVENAQYFSIDSYNGIRRDPPILISTNELEVVAA